ncbi:MAG: putative secreted protein [Actinomycetia bacterium]|nr:putative secreted protein [Actinomycetes bacterium]MDQ1657049.1 hypothetical protein [Cryptosporangiaceae bacterium]
MRWALLYARSRQVPAGILVVLLGTAGVWALAQATDLDRAKGAALALVASAGVLAAGLRGQDPELDRTASFSWIPRRAGHVLLIGVAAGLAVLARQAIGEDFAPVGFVARDSLGMLGLGALGAAVLGGQVAWTVPFLWFSVALFAPLGPEARYQALTWLLQPSGTPVATWTAIILGVTGTAIYALAGARR